MARECPTGGDGRESGGGDRGGYGRGRGGGRAGFSGGGGRGRGRGDYDVVKRNVRDLYEEPVNKLSKIKRNLIKKPMPGTEGKKIELIANHFRLLLQDMTYYHYDIDIKLGQESGTGFVAIAGPKERKMRKLAQNENMQVIRKLANEWREVFGGKAYVFDGQKNLYTKDKLRISDGKQVSRYVSIEFDGYREQTYEVSVQFANEVHISLINDFYDGKLDYIPQEAFQALEIVLRFTPTQTRIPVGRSLYNREDQTYIGENANMAYGHYQSVNLTEVGPTVLIDRSCTLIRTAGTLLDFIKNSMRGVRDMATTPFNDQMISALNFHLSGLKIYTEHVGGKRKFTIDSLSFLKPDECKFEVNEKTGSGKKATTVTKYFKDEYNITLNYRNIPCLLVKGGHKRYLPVEVCKVYEDQPLPRKNITPTLTAEVVRRSGQQKPLNRFSVIQESAETIENESHDLLNQMGVQMITKPIKVNARVMIPPNIQGSDKRVFDGKKLNEWCFVNLSPNVRAHKQKVNQFIDNLIDEGKRMGINIETKPSKVVDIEYKGQKTIDNIFMNAKNLCKNLQIILFCIPSENDIYYDIKYCGDMKYGIITQCIKDERLLDTPRGYFSNFLLKINGKLDGRNTSISAPERPLIMKTPTIIIGADVTHPAPADRMLSSVAACIGSYDKDFSHYCASITVQKRSRDEIITRFDFMIEELLNQFQKCNKILPKNIVVFRDGVSEGQFDQVLDHEYQLLVETCHKLEPNYKPLVTFIIVQKRHHTRFLPLKEADALGKAGNIPPGTVVDTTVTHPSLHEYFLCSHNGNIVSLIKFIKFFVIFKHFFNYQKFISRIFFYSFP